MEEWIALAIVTLTVLAVLSLSKVKQNWVRHFLDWFPAILFAYVIPSILTHIFKLQLGQVYLHTISKEWIIPIAILLVMTALPLMQLKAVGVKPILLFVSGSMIIAFLPVIFLIIIGWTSNGSKMVFYDQEYWKALVPIVGSWIGGSTSQMVLKEFLQVEEGLFLSIIVLDNVLVNIWTILMFQFIKRSDLVNRILKIEDRLIAQPTEFNVNNNITIWHVGMLCLVIVGITNLFITNFTWKITFLSVIGIAIANFIPRWNAKPGIYLGGIAIIVIMAVLGLKLDFENINLPPSLIIFLVCWLVGHFLIMVLISKWLNLSVVWVAIGSMANVGGISTAPAVTAAYNPTLMPHATLLAILSMITGTGWGLITAQLMLLIIK